MAIEIQVSSNIISGLDVLFVDLLLVTICHLITQALFRRLKSRKLFVNNMPDQLVSTSAGNLSMELLGNRPLAIIFIANSLTVIALSLLTGFGITGIDGIKLETPVEYSHADLSRRPLNITDLDYLVVEGHGPDRKTLWGSLFHQRNECTQLNMTHLKIIRMATNITSNDFSDEDGIWPPRSKNRTCLDPMHYADAKGKTVVSDSVLYVRRRYEIDSIGKCHVFYEGTPQPRELEQGIGNPITDTFTQPTVLRNCVPDDMKLESICAKGHITACITRFTTPENLDLVVSVTWDIGEEITESRPVWRNMVLTDVTRSDSIPALLLTESQKWNVAQMIAAHYASNLNEAVIASNSAFTKTRAQRKGQTVPTTRLSLSLFFIPLGLIITDILLLLLALSVVTIQLRAQGVGKVNVAADLKELLDLLREVLSQEVDAETTCPSSNNVQIFLRSSTSLHCRRRVSMNTTTEKD